MATSSASGRRREARPAAVDIFVLTAFLIHVWTILNMLWDVPSWLLHMSVGELAGAVGYTLLFALLESILLALPLILLAYVLPAKWRREQALNLTFLFLALSAAAALVLHSFESLWFSKRWIGAAWLLVLLSASFFVIRGKLLGDWIGRAAARLQLLVGIYVAADLLGGLIVLVRNL